jgi:SPP1 family predicted phage head-tail adaptor
MRTKEARALEHLVVIEQKQHIKDAIGGESDDIWIEFSKAYAEIKPITGKEFMSANAHQNSISHRVIIRFISGVKAEMRVVHDGRFFNIVSPRDFFEKKKWLELMCEELL